MKRIAFLVVMVVLLQAAASLGRVYEDTKVRSAAEAAERSPDANALATLEDYLRYAAMNNAGLKAAFEEWKVAIEQLPQAAALPDPRFTYSYFIEEVETRVGPQRQKVGIMQVFPWFGEIEARTDAAAATAKAARGRYDAKKLALFFEVKDAFFEYSYLAKAVEIARQNLELIEHFEEVARTKYIAAAASHPDVIRAQMELAKLEDHLRSLEQMRKPVVARLNAVLNRPGFGELPWPARAEFKQVQIERRDMITLLKGRNPELEALHFEVESAKSRVDLARKKFYPKVGVGVDWLQTDKAIMPGTPDSGKDPVILMFTLNLPVWRQSYRAAEEQAKADVRRTQHQKRQKENTLVAHAERALYDFEDSGRKIKLYADILVPKAEELLRVSETAYKGGTIDFLSLIDAQRMLLGYKLNYERAVTDNLQELAELEMLAGTLLPTINSAPADRQT